MKIFLKISYDSERSILNKNETFIEFYFIILELSRIILYQLMTTLKDRDFLQANVFMHSFLSVITINGWIALGYAEFEVILCCQFYVVKCYSLLLAPYVLETMG